jgi:phosphate butyryltransferase
MQMVKRLEDLVNMAAKNGRRTLIVAVAQDKDVLLAVKSASDAGLIKPLLVGDPDQIKTAAGEAGLDILNIDIFPVTDNQQACNMAAGMARDIKGSILMKGMVTTGILMKAVLDKGNGLMSGSLLSHIAFFESPFYHKLLCITDAALNISPDLQEKAGIINNAVDALHRLGVALPKVGILAAVETVNPKMEATTHAAMLVSMQKRNQIKGCLVDGPLALDNAISAEAAHHKGIVSEVAGNADILLAPDITSGNILYKSLIFLGGAVTAAMIVGASVPVVLTSRSDSDKSKFLSIALAAAME